jgi:hypothetical protein
MYICITCEEVEGTMKNVSTQGTSSQRKNFVLDGFNRYVMHRKFLL